MLSEVIQVVAQTGMLVFVVGGMAAMGWSMGAAIGAKLGRPDHLVVHLLGDASFGMTGMEVETALDAGLMPRVRRHLADEAGPAAPGGLGTGGAAPPASALTT